MLIHFPVALWPAHAGLHIFASKLPSGMAAVTGFWLLIAGTALGWLAALAGVSDLLGILKENSPPKTSRGFIHASVNGSVLVAFTTIAIMEYAHFPTISHGAAFLIAEGALLAAMGIGNFFGGSLIWQQRG
ncbi:MAG: DUF2231 domain-containing protein [Nibricoccus sp.]